MIGVVVIAHGNLAKEFQNVIEHIMGKQDYFTTLGIYPKDDLIEQRKNLLKKVEKVQQDQGVLILTDMFGGTPSNLAISIMQPNKIEVLAGVNIPMLVKLASTRSRYCLQEVITTIQEAGKKYIQQASHLLKIEKEKN